MPTQMSMAPLEFVAEGSPGSQRVAVLEAHGKLAIRHAAISQPGPGQLRIKVLYNGICGSDLEAYRGARQPEWVATPARLGHEVSGIVDAVGEGVLAPAIGDKVTARYVWGALAEYILATPFNLKVLPPSFPLKEISLIEVLPGVIHAAELAAITPHTDVLIMGQGVSGLVLTQVVKLFSPRSLVVTDVKQRNLDLALKYGATHAYRIPSSSSPTMETVGKDFPNGFEVVIPALLEGDAMSDALDCMATGGRIIAYGCIGTCRSFDFFKLHRRRGTIHSTEPRRDIDMRRFFDEGVRMVLDGLVNTGEMVTHVFPLSRVQEAFQLRNHGGCCGGGGSSGEEGSGKEDAIHVLIDCQDRGDAVTRF